MSELPEVETVRRGLEPMSVRQACPPYVDRCREEGRARPWVGAAASNSRAAVQPNGTLVFLATLLGALPGGGSGAARRCPPGQRG